MEEPPATTAPSPTVASRLSDNALLLAAATASAYVVGYHTELGFANARGVPEVTVQARV
jgi:hypothetical protein